MSDMNNVQQPKWWNKTSKITVGVIGGLILIGAIVGLSIYLSRQHGSGPTQSCPAGQQWDPTTNACVGTCNTGYVWDPTTKTCVPKCLSGANWNSSLKQCECLNNVKYDPACSPACCPAPTTCDIASKTCGQETGCSGHPLTVSETTGEVTGQLKINDKCTDVQDVSSVDLSGSIKTTLDNLCAATTCKIPNDVRCTLPTDVFKDFSATSKACAVGDCTQEADYYWPDGSQFCSNLKFQSGPNNSCTYPDNSHIKLACEQDAQGCGFGSMSDPLVCSNKESPCYKLGNVNTLMQCPPNSTTDSTMCPTSQQPCLLNGTGTGSIAKVCLPKKEVLQYRCPNGFEQSSVCNGLCAPVTGGGADACVPMIPDYICNKPVPVCPAGTQRDTTQCSTPALPCYTGTTPKCVALNTVTGCRPTGNKWSWNGTVCVSIPANTTLKIENPTINSTVEISGALSFQKASSDTHSFGDYQFRYRLLLNSTPPKQWDGIVTNVTPQTSCADGSVCVQYSIWLPNTPTPPTTDVYEFAIQAGVIRTGTFDAMYGPLKPVNVTLTKAQVKALLPTPAFSHGMAQCLSKELWANVSARRIISTITPVKGTPTSYVLPQSSQSAAAVIPCNQYSCPTETGEINQFLTLLTWRALPSDSLSKLCPDEESFGYKEIVYTLAKVPVTGPQPFAPGQDLRNMPKKYIVWQGTNPGAIDLPSESRCPPMPQSGLLPIMSVLDSVSTNTVYAYYLFVAAGIVSGGEVQLDMDPTHNCYSPPTSTIVGPLEYSGQFCASIPAGSGNDLLNFLVYNPGTGPGLGGCDIIQPGEEASAAFYACMFRHPQLLGQNVDATQLWIPNTPTSWGESSACAAMMPTTHPKITKPLSGSISAGYCTSNDACLSGELIQREARCGCPDGMTTGMCESLASTQLPAAGLYSSHGSGAQSIPNVFVSKDDFQTQVTSMTTYMCNHCLFSKEQESLAASVCPASNPCGYK